MHQHPDDNLCRRYINVHKPQAPTLPHEKLNKIANVLFEQIKQINTNRVWVMIYTDHLFEWGSNHYDDMGRYLVGSAKLTTMNETGGGVFVVLQKDNGKHVVSACMIFDPKGLYIYSQEAEQNPLTPKEWEELGSSGN